MLCQSKNIHFSTKFHVSSFLAYDIFFHFGKTRNYSNFGHTNAKWNSSKLKKKVFHLPFFFDKLKSC